MLPPALTVSNTSPLTNLAVIGRLSIVRRQFEAIVIPEVVWHEMNALDHSPGRHALQAAMADGWLIVRPPASATATLMTAISASGLDAGESAAIALAVTENASRLLIDERRGRAMARHFHLPMTGALGILAVARHRAEISSMQDEINKLRDEAGFYISAEIEAAALRLAGE